MKRLDLVTFLCARLKVECNTLFPENEANALLIDQLLVQTKSSGMTVLHYAASKGALEIVRYLVQDLNVSAMLRNTQGQLPIHRAVLSGSSTEMLSVLLTQGKGGNIFETTLKDISESMLYSVDKSGSSLLHIALENKDDTLVKYLLKIDAVLGHGASGGGFKDIKNIEGLNPEELAHKLSYQI